MPIMILIAVMVALLLMFAYMRLKHSKKFENFIRSIVEDEKPTPEVIIEDAKKAEDELNKIQSQREKEAEALRQESSKIKDFLNRKNASAEEDDVKT